MVFFFFFPPLHLAFAVGRDKEKVLCTKKYLEAVGMLRDFKNSSQDPDFTQVRNYSFHSFSCALPYFNITVVSFFKETKTNQGYSSFRSFDFICTAVLFH